MSKEKLTKEKLQEKKLQLQSEIENLQKVIDASDTSVFDILVNEIKTTMNDNIAEENWKELKQNQKKIEAYRDVEKIIQNQNDLLERKQDELEDVEYQLNNFQLNMFNDSEDTQPFAKATGIKYAGNELETGDIFKSNIPSENGECVFYMIKESAEIKGSFAIISNIFEDEKLLQYPKNQELLSCTNYIGNIFKDNEDQENALKGLEIISSAHENKPQEKY